MKPNTPSVEIRAFDGTTGDLIRARMEARTGSLPTNAAEARVLVARRKLIAALDVMNGTAKQIEGRKGAP